MAERKMAESSGFSRIVMRGAGLVGGGFVLVQVMNMAFLPVLTRLTTKAEFGVFALGGIVAMVAPAFAEGGMMSALIQRGDERMEEAANSALLATLAAGFGLSLLALAVAPLIGLFFHSHKAALIAAALAPWPFLRGAVAVPDALMQRRFSFLRRAVVDPLSTLLQGAGSIVGTALGWGAWGLVLGMYAWGVTRLIATWALARWRPHPRLASFRMWRELARFGRHVITAETIGAAKGNVDKILLGRLFNVNAVGSYSNGLKLAQAPITAWGSVAFVLFPAYSRISHDIERLRRAFLRSLRWVSTAAMPLSFVFLPLGTPVAVIYFGPSWRQAGTAMMAMCAFGAGSAIVLVANEAFKASGHPRYLTRLQIVLAALSIGFMFALFEFGVAGVSSALSISAVGAGVCALVWLAPIIECPRRDLLRVIWAPLVASLVMACSMLAVERLVVRAAAHHGIVGLGLLAGEFALAGAIYLVCLAALSPSTLGELLGALRRGRSGREVSEAA